MQTTITPVDNSIYIERNYDTNRIENTIQGAVIAQKEWSNLSVQQRVQLLSKFVEDFLSKGDLIAEELTRQIGRPISQAPGELRGFKERADYMLSIAERKLANIDIQATFTDKAIAEIAKAGFDPIYGARPLKRAIQNEIENPLSKEILGGKLVKQQLKIDFEKNKFTFTV